MLLLPSLGAVPANHLPRWVPPQALLARGSVDGATNLSSSSTALKVNNLFIKHLHFWSVCADLQEDKDLRKLCHLNYLKTKITFHVHPFLENTDYENLSIGKWGIED